MPKLLAHMNDEQAHADHKQYFCAALQGILARRGAYEWADTVRRAWDIADEAAAQSHDRQSLTTFLKRRLDLD